MKPSAKNQRSVSPVIILLWLGLAVSGTIAMMAYSLRPGLAGSAPANWPATSKVPRRPDRSTLVMFIHPKCSCSAASINELAVLMTHCQERVSAHVLFVRPPSQATNWVLTDTYRSASEIPGVAIARDDEGREARLFGAETSGDVVLYDAGGQLRFQGGMTTARGHSGDNPGRDALQAVLLNGSTSVKQTPVFGCGLFDCCQEDRN